MSKPAAYPVWATDAGATITPSAGKQAAGHISGEKPVPGYVNWIHNLTYQWVQYLDGLNTSTKTTTLAGAGLVALSGSGSPTVTYNSGFAAAPVNGLMPLPLPVGGTIVAVRARIKDNATGPTKLELSVVDASGSGAGWTQLGTSATSSGAGTDQTLACTGLATTITSNHSYYATVSTPTGSASCNVYSIEVDYTMPA